MEWTQVVFMTVTIFGTFLWNRGEARADARRAEDLISAIRDDVRDFHGRLCAIEERNRRK